MSHNYIPGHGAVGTKMMMIGNAPNREDDWKRRPFSGKIGEELKRHLEENSLPRLNQWWLSNIYNFWGGKDYEYTAADYEQGTTALCEQLSHYRPLFIVTLGREATQFFMGDVDMEDVHALPWYMPQEKLVAFRLSGIMLPPEIVIFPLYHPAGGFHNPEVSGYVLYGFQQLGSYFKGTTKARVLYDDPYQDQEDYREITQESEIAVAPGRINIDTEGYVHAPWSIQYSQRDGTGYTIKAKNAHLVKDLSEKIRKAGAKPCFHSALHELSMTRAMGIPMDDLQFDDTMVMSYLLQVEPRGLKPLSTRHCNMRMQSYDDVMGDVGNELAYQYAIMIHDCEQEDYEVRQQEEFEAINTTPLVDKDGNVKRAKDGSIKYRKTRVMPKVPKTALHRSAERILRSSKPRKLWGDQIEDVQVAGYKRLGPMAEPSLDYIQEPVALRYASRDPDATGRVAKQLEPKIDEMGLRDVYDLELGTYPLIDRMSYVGIKPDLAHFAAMSTDLQFEIDAMRTELCRSTGIADFNANSGDQVADYIFGSLGLEGYKRTSEGRYSTNDKVLEALEKEHPEIIDLQTIRSYREVYKLKNTFVDRIPDFVRRYPFDGRVHATFRTTSVVTGRLAASDPNLLAQPKHGKFAKRFRRGWTAADGHWLGEWDLSQIELRVLAHLSQDPVLLAAFRNGVDLHGELAARIFGGKATDYARGTERTAAKAINFGIPMGMTYKGLTVELRKNGVMVSENDAELWLNDTMKLYSQVAVYQERMRQEAKQNGYIRCLSGRVRYIGGSRSFDQAVRAEADRFAASTPIQEGAQWLMKQAERKIWDMIVRYQRQGRWVEPLLQVHDAINLEFEADEALAKEINGQMVQIMSWAPSDFSVPVSTSGDYGLNMADMEEFK